MLKKEEDFSFLISSHILPELEKVCEHVVLVNAGKAVRQGKLTQLLSEIAPQTFAVKVQPAEPLVEMLKREKCVKSVSLENDALLVVARDVDAFKQRLPTLVSQAGASLEEVKSVGRDLESLFKAAVKGGG